MLKEEKSLQCLLVVNKASPLKSSSSFKNVTLKGSRKQLSPWVNLQVMKSPDSNNYFGITISRKVANSVIRNKLKRWVRSCVQNEEWPTKYNGFIIVFVFRSQADSEFFTKKKYSDFLSIYKKI